MSVTIITGTPGAGKTSISHLLSNEQPNGVHMETDVFFHFLSHRIDPSLPESNDQNITVINAYTKSAVEYAAGGYSVFMDGVIGPWQLPLISPVLKTFEYVILNVSLDIALARARERTSQASAQPVVIRRMHDQFSRIIQEYEKHVIQTNNKTLRQIADEYLEGKAKGNFTIRNS
ncbi:MAG: AAA family ATPase [Proteobacteria bacterium]|nr:AAA family ATPase [Pseudomonadota bacterium]MBU4471292.1 AAA family ATPase [Pseudomonadota bacterium]MCG2751703.1 AAA family ATPase [Desulfobacteraceae bacterium]